MDEPESPSAEPATALDDARLQFFLEHQDQIRTWAALATEVQDAVEDLLRELRVDVIADPTVNRLGIRVGSRVNGETPTGPVLYRQSWCVETESAPDVGVAIGWDGRVDPAGTWPKSNVPYVGVLSSRHSEAGRAIEARLRELSAPALLADRSFRKGSYWVVYRPIRSSKDWWRDVPSWRAGLVAELHQAWAAWSELIDESVAHR